ncbi:uncharacterized protein LOC130961835 [Arachis stenosperma]|uniref:uncharacterized protein LOC130961835 n=1 Tax=Arachis stenosperma TaxID=217475 RepID=UPI0025AB656E|nr:uncharacterized protein LOC130961835 [Arachis stenosperma]
MRPRGGRSAREETRKTDCRRSASPPSNCYSRRALSVSPLSFSRRHLCLGSWSLLNEEGEFKSASEGRKKESLWRSRSPSSRLLLPSTKLVVRGASPTSLLMNRLRLCCDLARPHTPFILVSKSAQFFPCSDSIYETTSTSRGVASLTCKPHVGSVILYGHTSLTCKPHVGSVILYGHTRGKGYP